ncbi:oxidoreductase [Flavobacterium sp. LB2P44]|uniref:sialidase family protein n=1 Tax=Flavobacterium sp. LB2P44 TaxID=3401713 RepID=UPI003AAA8BDB
MKNIILVLMCLFVFVSCKTSVNTTSLSSIIIDTLFQDKISIRAIQIDKNKIWYAADNGRYGFYNLNTNKKTEKTIVNDSLKLEFRSIAQTRKHIFILNVANPAFLYQISKDNNKNQLVYQENHENVFYDSMQFWDAKEGIAMGDPINNCLNIITTLDGGKSWQKIPCSKLPSITTGEAAFAASNTNIVIKKNNTWIVSGGKKSRVFYSPDRGNNWSVYETPIVQGKSMTGIFTADFYDSNNGFVAGGDYEVKNQNFSNKAVTADGGKTWKLVGQNQAFGYASCVQYIPKSNGKKLISVGTSGIYYSRDSGTSWTQLAADSSLFTIRFINKKTAIAAGQNKMIRINFK